jgi:tRNA threonylcarbamoyladenosine biosynthesis protein TsaE
VTTREEAPHATDERRALLSEADLTRWGEQIGASAPAPLVIALHGPLGAGKSVLARAVARGAGVHGAIPSPTFNLLFRYPAAAGREIVHLDLYRIRGPEELGELGWDELGLPHEILLVEWAERAGRMLPAHRWDVELRPVYGDPLLREVTVTAKGQPAGIAALPQSSVAPRG